MANSANAGAANYIVSDYMGLESLYTTRRKYDISDKIISLDRATAVFDYRLRQLGKKFAVGDPEPKVLVDTEQPLKFTTTNNGADVDYEGDTFYLTDADAKWLQAGDVLMVPQIFCDSDGAAYSTTKYGYAAPETVIVQSVVLSGKAAGYASVKCFRGNGYQRSAAAAGVVTTIATSYTLIWMGNSIPSGGNAPNPRDKEMDSTQDYTQFRSVTCGEDEQYTNTDVYGKKTFEQRFAETRNRLNRQIEFDHFFGRKGKRLIAGKEAWLAGGIVEYVADATAALDGTSRRFNMSSTFSVALFRKYMEITFRYGSPVKWGFTGGKFFTEMETYLEKFLVFNDKLSGTIKLPVFVLETGHGTIELMRHSMLTEMSNSSLEWALDMILVDPNFVEVMYLQNMDMKIRQNIQDNRAHGKEAEYYGQVGLRRNHPTAHALIYGMQESN